MQRMGIWLDRADACIVNLDGSPQVSWIQSQVERPHKATGGVGSPRPYLNYAFRKEERNERRREQELHRYYEKIREKVRPATHLVIFGPGLAKKEFQKTLNQDKSYDPKIELISTPQLSENQILEQVKVFYHEPPVRKLG